MYNLPVLRLEASHQAAHLAKPLCVCRPQHNDLVDCIVCLEGSNVLPHSVHLLLAGALDHICCSRVLVRGYEIWIKDPRQGLQVLHVRRQLPLQLIVQDLRFPNELQVSLLLLVTCAVSPFEKAALRGKQRLYIPFRLAT